MIVHVFYPKKGGKCISIYRSFEPYICALKQSDDVHEYFVPYEGGNPLKMLKNIFYVKRHRTNMGINHITGDIHYCILGLIKVYSVLTIHDDQAIRMNKRGRLDVFRKWLLWFYLPIKYAKAVVCISPQTRDNVYLHVKSNKYKVLAHHCMNEEFIYEPKTFCKKCPVVFQVGTSPNKNLETTIYALINIPSELHVLKEMTKEQKELADSLGVKFKNFFNLTNQEVIEEYKKADIVVFPSLFEGFGMPIIEGQATGRVVITSNLPPMNWVSGDAAVLLDNPQNALELKIKILNVINDDKLREEYIKRGLENVKRFSLQEILLEYKKIYKSIINKKQI